MNTQWTRRRFLEVSGGTVLGALAIAACGDDGGTRSAASLPTTTTTTPPGALPFNDEFELRDLFDPFFEPLDQKVTRIGLYDLTSGFVRSDGGDHVAIYVEPIDPDAPGWDTAKYIEAIAPGMAACTPFIFETWSGVNSMDLCQEPPQRMSPEPEPPIVTQINLARADSSLIPWESVTLAHLMAADLRSPRTVRVAANDEVKAHPLWTEAEAAAPDLV